MIPFRWRKCFFVLFILLGFCLGCVPVWSQINWLAPEWTRRLTVEIQIEERQKNTHSAIVDFWSGAEGAPMARDVRVVNESGQLLGSKMLFMDCGSQPVAPDHCILAFEVPDGTKKYYVYFGNLNSAPSPQKWNPKAGLILETRFAQRGRLDTWFDLQGLVSFSASRERIYGAAIWPQVFDGRNPFGPSTDFISIYRGYLDCREDGPYMFATTSRDASFLFVDGEVIAQWPGHHGPIEGQWGQFSGEIIMPAGVHELKYVNVCRRGQPVCVAGWRKPSDKEMGVIPEEAFVPFHQALS